MGEGEGEAWESARCKWLYRSGGGGAAVRWLPHCKELPSSMHNVIRQRIGLKLRLGVGHPLVLTLAAAPSPSPERGDPQPLSSTWAGAGGGRQKLAAIVVLAGLKVKPC